MAGFVHPTAVVDDDVSVGGGTRIWHFVHVSEGARIGARCVLGQNVFIGRGVRIGDGVKVQNNVSVYEGVEVEDEVFLGPSCVFTNVVTPRAFIERKQAFATTRVGRGASVGANATIICGHDLGAYCLVGAAAVVTRDVAPHAIVVGNPARFLAWACSCGQRLPQLAAEQDCGECGRRYRTTPERCEPLT
ncbi:MAG: acetyltransferase [Myxococcales bacterium]|nr:acetyltransferase [Myxococcales bacterium]